MDRTAELMLKGKCAESSEEEDAITSEDPTESEDADIDEDEDSEYEEDVEQTVKQNEPNPEGYSLIRKIGNGSFSTVYCATSVLTGEMVAVKIIDKQLLCSENKLTRVLILFFSFLSFFFFFFFKIFQKPIRKFDIIVWFLTFLKQEKLLKEIQALYGLNHPNIVQVREVKDTERKLYIITEYCNSGDVLKLIRAQKVGF